MIQLLGGERLIAGSKIKLIRRGNDIVIETVPDIGQKPEGANKAFKGSVVVGSESYGGQGDIRASGNLRIRGYSEFLGEVRAKKGINVGLATGAGTGDIRASGNIIAKYGGSNATIGDVGHGSSFAAFAHLSAFSTGAYALLSQSDGATYLNAASGKFIYFRINNITGMQMDAQKLYIGDDANANMTQGLTINQGANDNEILALKSSDVAHGITGVTETDTFAHAQKLDAVGGGLHLQGLTDGGETNKRAVLIAGILGQTADTTKSTAARGIIELNGSVKSGTSHTGPAANSNLVTVGDNASGTTRFILDSDGDSHQDVGTAWTNFDSYDDTALLNSLARHVSRPEDPIKEEFRDWVTYNRPALEQAKLVSFNEDGHHFVNMSKLTMLLVGTVRQQGARIESLERRLLAA